MKFGIGQPVPRWEDLRLVTGSGYFTDDIELAGAAHGWVLRSTYAHAEIAAVDTSAARDAPGVLAVLTGDDVTADGLGDMPCVFPLKNRDGTPRHDTPRPILAIGKVRHVGQPVAFVVAETLDQARDAAELIEVDYRELPAVVDVRAAVETGAPQLFDHVPGNLCFDWENGDKAATDAAFAEAARVVSLDLVNNRVVANSMEPRNAIGDYDPATDRVTLYSSTQGPHFVLDPLAEAVLKLPKEKVRVVTPNVGGGFGMKAFLYPEQCLVTWASRRLARPVRWQSDRSEGFMSDSQGRDHRSHAELALDVEGRFLGLRVTSHVNLGAYLSQMGAFVPTLSTDMVAGLYTTPAIYVTVLGCLTNTVPVCAYRGAGRPEAAYLIERLADAAARELGLSPAEIRRRNLIPPDALPYTTATKVTYDSGEFQAIMEECMRQADWDGFEARRHEAEARGRLRGIGMATYTERCGGGFPETAIVTFGDDDAITIAIGNQEFGTGLITAYRQVTAEYLGVDPDRVRVLMGDSDRVQRGLSGGSRGLPVGGSAIAVASERIVEKGKPIAAHLLEAAAVDIEYGEGRFRVVGTDREISLFEVARAARDQARLPEGMEPTGLDETYSHNPTGATFPNGCHVVEVEIDSDTGTVEIARYTVVDDFGRIINPVMLEGQVHGGIAQGLGQALWEHTVYEDGTGQLVAGSFMDYTMPRADNLPFVHFATRNVPCRNNPLGVKGSGEAGAIGAPPAVINAIVDALHARTGITHVDMPATPDRIWRILHQGPAAA